jgi:crotonobetainyl-CoA:carnitine CoA-transferase CaiB-like acyl-CoA transferase
MKPLEGVMVIGLARILAEPWYGQLLVEPRAVIEFERTEEM